jgi:hypothetical protein
MNHSRMSHRFTSSPSIAFSAPAPDITPPNNRMNPSQRRPCKVNRPLARPEKYNHDFGLNPRDHIGKQPLVRKSLCVTMKYDPRRMNLAGPNNENFQPAYRSRSDYLETTSAALMLDHLPVLSTASLLTLKQKIESVVKERAAVVDAKADETEDWDVLADDQDMTASEIQYDFVDDAGIVKQYEK